MVLLTAAGPIFSAGIDLASIVAGGGIGGAVLVNGDDGNGDGDNDKDDPVVRVAASVLREGGNWQRCWQSLTECSKPVVTAIQGGCYGAALELVCYADVRFASADCVFQAQKSTWVSRLTLAGTDVPQNCGQSERRSRAAALRLPFSARRHSNSGWCPGCYRMRIAYGRLRSRSRRR